MQPLVIPHALRVVDIRGYTLEQDRKKRAFHRAGMSWLRAIAQRLGLPQGSYDVRSNKAGPAVSGEVTLHGEDIYVQVYESCIGQPGLSILYRRCKGRKDYCGEQNHHERIDRFTDAGYVEVFIANLQRVRGRAN